MRRRSVLATLSVGGGLSIAGCSSVLDFTPAGTVLGTIRVVNLSLVPNRIRLSVQRGDETLLERSIGLTSIDAETRASATIIDPVWSETRGKYTVRALHVDDAGNRESSSREYTFTRDDYEGYYGDSHEDPGCIGAVVTIGSLDDRRNGTIGISPTYVEHPCGTPPSG